MLLDVLIGPMLIGTVLNVWLFGFTCTQCFLYFNNYRVDPLWLRSLVIFILVADTINTALDVAFVYQYTVTHFGDFEYLQISDRLLNSDPVMTVLLSATVQTFFAWRVWMLTDHLWLGLVITISALASFLAGIGTTVGCSIVKQFVQFDRIELRAVVTVWLAMSVLTDSIITVALVSYLQRKKTGSRVIDGLINSILRLTIQTGLLTTLFATADLLCFATMDNSIHLIPNLPLGKLYSNSLLSTLNARAEWGNSTQGLRVKPPASTSSGRKRSTTRTDINTGTDLEWASKAESSATGAHAVRPHPTDCDGGEYELTRHNGLLRRPEKAFGTSGKDVDRKREFGETSDLDHDRISS